MMMTKRILPKKRMNKKAAPMGRLFTGGFIYFSFAQ